MRGRAAMPCVALAGVVASCTPTVLPMETDRCEGIDTCVELEVDGLLIERIDQLVIDLLYAGHHDTDTVGTPGREIALPVSIPLAFDLPGSPLIDVDVFVAGRLGGAVLGLDAGSTTVQQGAHGHIRVFLSPSSTCDEGKLYCGGVGGVFAEPRSLYRCTGGVPIFYTQCKTRCTSHSDADAVCGGNGLCRDGGTYCGGHVVDGDPSTLYTCAQFQPINPRPCPAGCVEGGDGQDACR
jgi:hypothetical protein